MQLSEFQDRIDRLYGERDRRRGVPGTFLWFSEEVGELARALHRGDRQNLEEEFADVLAWLTTLANLTGVDLACAADARYGDRCHRCGACPCACGEPGPKPPKGDPS